jgi:hypothetical protein
VAPALGNTAKKRSGIGSIGLDWILHEMRPSRVESTSSEVVFVSYARIR